MNEYDSDCLAQSLINSGLSSTYDPETADLILVNTCTVRAKPEQKAFSFLGRMSRIKKRRPGIIIGVLGCLAQQYGASLIKRFPDVDLVIGPRELHRIDEILEKVGSARGRVVATGLESWPFRQIHCQGYFTGRVTGFISIMEGCNNFCSYCIVPFVRGREISRSPYEIIKEAKGLISDKVKEVTLLGQNVNSYLWQEGKKWDFPSLLREFNEMEGLLRLRFTTSHPKDLSDGLIHCFGDLDKLCPHIHLPFQAGSNRILKRMRRGYTRENYFELVWKLRETRPEIAITSDVMVGFPGETERDFEMTLDLVKRVQFDALFSFKYSDRKGTPAEKMDNKVEEAEKSFRLGTLQTLQKEITLMKNKGLEGKAVEILVDGESKKGGLLTGRTGSNKVINIPCDHIEIGQLVKVDINRAFVNSLRGKPA